MDRRRFFMSAFDISTAVKERYASGAKQSEPALCCPVQYDPKFLKIIPAEVIERDYGCGDPSAYLREGETVLDLGSGTGKICFIASQVVGPTGRVIGVDMTDAMLEVARRNAPIVAERVGYSNVEFRKGRIQDLGLDLDLLDTELRNQPISSADAFLSALQAAESLRIKKPLVATESVDVVVSNCVLNLVESNAKRELFHEIYRVLRLGGRAVISDIVSDEDVPMELQNDPELWSGCISGALTESGFLAAFEEAGFYGIRILKRDATPWQVVDNIEFRSLTVEAYKGKDGPCMERNQAVIFKGPFSEVKDDDGHVFRRGLRHAVCDKTFQILNREPYASFFEPVEPHTAVPTEEAKPYNRTGQPLRHPKESKGQDYDAAAAMAHCTTQSCC